jgi:hypothetical protein
VTASLQLPLVETYEGTAGEGGGGGCGCAVGEGLGVADGVEDLDV